MREAPLGIVQQRLAARPDSQRRAFRPMHHESTIRIESEGSRLINFSSNDYLSLSQHPLLKARACQYIQRFGVGGTSSRLVTGDRHYFHAVEARLAHLKEAEGALLFPSGYQLNVSLLPALVQGPTVLLLDRLCHHSLIQGALASGVPWRRYRHNDMNHLDALLKAYTPSHRCVVVTETLFSMDGDRAPLQALRALTAKFGAILVMDDAHALGILGEGGAGLATGPSPLELIVGTFGKAFGSSGAFLAFGAQWKEYFLNFCGGLIYTTALPPATVGAIDAALDLLPGLNDERLRVQDTAFLLRTWLNDAGGNTMDAVDHIIPLHIGSESRVLQVQKDLERQGLLAIAIRPPTVPQGKSRLRLSLTASHNEGSIRSLLSAIRPWLRLS